MALARKTNDGNFKYWAKTFLDPDFGVAMKMFHSKCAYNFLAQFLHKNFLYLQIFLEIRAYKNHYSVVKGY